MIRTTKSPRKNRKAPTIFKDMPLAHQWCQGNGIELGAAAHNPFHLQGALHVSPGDDLDVFRKAEIDLCGAYAEIDIVAEANSIPVDDASQDYVISSHVVEHLPNPIGAFFEWNRILKAGGVVFMILPKRDALQHDAVREIVTIEELAEAQRLDYNVDTFPAEKGVNRRGHYYVYTLETLVELINFCNESYGLQWEIVATEETDSKVGNGFTVVARKINVDITLKPVPTLQNYSKDPYPIVTTGGVPDLSEIAAISDDTVEIPEEEMQALAELDATIVLPELSEAEAAATQPSPKPKRKKKQE